MQVTVMSTFTFSTLHNNIIVRPHLSTGGFKMSGRSFLIAWACASMVKARVRASVASGAVSGVPVIWQAPR